MIVDKIKEVLALYRKKFEEMGIPKKKSSHNSFLIIKLPSGKTTSAFTKVMTDKVKSLLNFLKYCVQNNIT